MSAGEPGAAPTVDPLSPITEPIPRRPAGATVPLSFGQELLWLLARSHGELVAYNLPRVYRFSGRLDQNALQRALDRVVERHEILRTAFVAVGGSPIQFVRAPYRVPIAVVELPASAGDEQIAAAVREAARMPIPLDDERQLRGAVIRRGPDDATVVLTSHHITSDGWSRRILETELQTFYNGFVRGETPESPEATLQFGDYAVWERGAIGGDSLDRLLDHWRGALRDAPQELNLPTDWPRSPMPRFEGARTTRSLAPELLPALDRAAAATSASRFMVSLAAFQALMGRHANQEDLLVAVPIADRDRAELQTMMGYLVNTVPVRGRPQSDKPFSVLVAETRAAVLDANEHRGLPFETIATEVARETGSQPPHLRVSFAFGEAAAPGAAAMTFEGLRRERVSFDPGWAKFDLSLTLAPTAQGLASTLEYRTDLFTADTADRILERYEALLAGALANRETAVGALPVMAAAERHRVVFDWNQTAAPLPPRPLIHELIAERTRTGPLAVAASAAGIELTYGELDRRAAAFARRLRRLGVRSEEPVGVFLEPSLDLPVALLGILKAGAACMPLDPSYPGDRLRLMMTDAGIRLLATSRDLAPELADSAATAIYVDEADDSTDEATLPDVEADATAYLLYTSGSTGSPRGVQLTHRGIVNHNLAVISLYGIGPKDRVLQFSSLSFDISMEEMFPTWIAGGTVVFRPRDLPILGPEFCDWLDANAISVMDVPTAYWHELTTSLADAGGRLPAGLRLMVIGGEKAHTAVYEKWRSIAPGSRLINSYGPTEATCIVTAWEATGERLDRDVPLGRPIANTRTYILDRNRQPVPIGVAGELFLAGAGVAKGYLNQPELTASKFLPDTLTDPNQRMYATGDRARFLATGEIEFLGRDDDQVKIRGFRVERGEVETTLARCPGVRESAVVVVDGASGKQLVAYFAPAGNATESDVRSWLRAELPSFMVPQIFVAVSSLPRTPNGKIDRKSLPPAVEHDPEPGPAATHDNPDEDASNHPLWPVMLQIWGGLFPKQRIGLDDDFFAVGGHSLLAARMIEAIFQGTGLRLPIAALYEGATIRQIVSYLLTHGSRADTPEYITIKSGDPARPALFLLHGDMTGGGFYARNIAGSLPAQRAFYAIPPRPADDTPATASIEGMAEWHLRTVRRLQPRGPYLLAGFCVGGLIALEISRRLLEDGEKVAMLMLIDTSMVNIRFRRWVPLIRAFARVSRPTPHGQTALTAYLMARVRRISALPVGELLPYLAGFPFRFLKRKLRKRRPQVATVAATAAAPALAGDLTDSVAAVLHHHGRLAMAYLPRPYRGRVELVRAIEPDRRERDPSRGWSGLIDDLHLIRIEASHHGLLFTELPRVMQESVARAMGEEP